MISIKKAYIAAEKLSEAKHLRQILSFDKGFGFIFTTSKNEVDIGSVCILIDKKDPDISALIPIIFENLDFLNTGKEMPLTMIK